MACLDIPKASRDRQVDAIAKAIRAAENHGKQSMLAAWQEDIEKWEKTARCSDQEWEEILTALHFYAEPAVYSPIRSGDSPPVWCDTDEHSFLLQDDATEDAPGAMARAIICKVDPQNSNIYGLLVRELEKREDG